MAGNKPGRRKIFQKPRTINFLMEEEKALRLKRGFKSGLNKAFNNWADTMLKIGESVNDKEEKLDIATKFSQGKITIDFQ